MRVLLVTPTIGVLIRLLVPAIIVLALAALRLLLLTHTGSIAQTGQGCINSSFLVSPRGGAQTIQAELLYIWKPHVKPMSCHGTGMYLACTGVYLAAAGETIEVFNTEELLIKANKAITWS